MKIKKCTNCGAYKWKYYKKYNGHGCGNCGFLYLDNEFRVVLGIPIRLQVLENYQSCV